MSAGAGTIQVVCPQCNKQLAVPAQHAGKQGRCPACKSIFAIPAAAPQPLPASPQPFAAPPQYAPQPNWQAAPQQAAYASAPWPAPAPAAPTAGPGVNAIPSPYHQAPAAPAWNATPQPSPFPQHAGYSQPSPFGPPSAPQPMPMNGFQPLYQNQNFAAAPAQAANPFADQNDGELRLAPAEAMPASQSLAPAYSPYSTPATQAPDPYSGAFGTEKKGMDAGILGGMGLMLLAVVWFFGGLAFGIIFPYAPVLFIIGIVAVVRGLFNR